MTTVTVAGEVTSALTHFAQFGLASIIESEIGCRTKIGWHDERKPTAFVDCEALTDRRVGEVLLAHARRAVGEESWLRATVDHGGRPATAAFSPRIKVANSDTEWRNLQRVRQTHVDLLMRDGRDGDLSFIGALGEPAYWRIENNRERRPDHGASRWEMKTRNRGEEFVGQRLLPLAEVLAARSVEEIVSGVSGTSRRDELGKDKPESRTSTGFTLPGPTDSALAWCALWGIANFPLAHRVHALSVTPGAFPTDVLHPRWMYLPVVVGSVSLARVRSLIVSPQLEAMATVGLDTRKPVESQQVMVEAARKWLFRRKVVAVARFRISKSGSASAPERQVLGGELLLTGEKDR